MNIRPEVCMISRLCATLAGIMHREYQCYAPRVAWRILAAAARRARDPPPCSLAECNQELRRAWHPALPCARRASRRGPAPQSGSAAAQSLSNASTSCERQRAAARDSWARPLVPGRRPRFHPRASTTCIPQRATPRGPRHSPRPAPLPAARATPRGPRHSPYFRASLRIVVSWSHSTRNASWPFVERISR